MSQINQSKASAFAFMGTKQVLCAVFFTLTVALMKAEAYSSQIFKGKVACLDHPNDADLSGLQILIKCDNVKKFAITYTESDGSFETKLPSDVPESSKPTNCMAKIMGGPYQVYVPSTSSLIPIAETEESGHFAATKPLSFYKACPFRGKCGTKDMGFASSKTVDLPWLGEWGLAPSSYYFPFVPIIGIP